MKFPIHEVVDDVKASLSQSLNVVVQAAPGAGKSTILPLELRNEPWLDGKKILMLEPRRLAARSITHRMSDLLNEKAGQTVGYRIRFESCVSAQTKIEVVTEAILIRMLQSDSALSGFGMVIFDEFHERSLNADLALTLCLQVQQLLREDLRLLIMSATLDGEKIAGVLNGAPVITSIGRSFPVEIHYDEGREEEFLISKATRVIRKAIQKHKGDILVFLPGAGEIQRVSESLLDLNDVEVLMLYANLPFAEQQRAIQKLDKRKIVLATNIAETSLTIEGVTVVIDSGVARIPRFNPRSGLTSLETVRISKDSADQRAGRAGRLEPGVCYRLWSKSVQSALQRYRTPEILEADLTTLALELLQWGADVNDLVWLTKPPQGAISQARMLLASLDAQQDGKITARGREMCLIPTHPRIAHLLLEAQSDSERQLACDIAALLEERDPSPSLGADFSLRVNLLRDYREGKRINAGKNVLARIEQLAASWRSYFKLTTDNAHCADYQVGRLLMAAYPERVARQESKHSPRYKLANGKQAVIFEHDPLVNYEWIVVASLDSGTNQGKIFMGSPVALEDLTSTRTVDVVRWDSQHERVTAAVERNYHSLVIDSKPLKTIPEEEKNKVIVETVRKNGLKMLEWNDAVEQLRCRIMSLRSWRSNEPWPDFSESALLDSLEVWLVPYLVGLTKLEEIKALDFKQVLAGSLPWELQSQIDLLAPERMVVPSGSAIKLNYNMEGRPPELSVRLQEVFGLQETPAVNNGKIRVLMHLLSPGYKPMQVTQDLRSFWTHTYFEIRKELRSRYPKHSWPDDPLNAIAVRGVRKK